VSTPIAAPLIAKTTIAVVDTELVSERSAWTERVKRVAAVVVGDMVEVGVAGAVVDGVFGTGGAAASGADCPLVRIAPGGGGPTQKSPQVMSPSGFVHG